MTLPKEIEENVEAVLVEWLDTFDATATEASALFKRMGIEPTYETLLGYSVGLLDSLIGGFIHSFYDRGMTPEEDDALVELIKRTLPELDRKITALLRENGR